MEESSDVLRVTADSVVDPGEPEADDGAEEEGRVDELLVPLGDVWGRLTQEIHGERYERCEPCGGQIINIMINI